VGGDGAIMAPAAAMDMGAPAASAAPGSSCRPRGGSTIMARSPAAPPAATGFTLPAAAACQFRRDRRRHGRRRCRLRERL
jgi:hypothetical protein